MKNSIKEREEKEEGGSNVSVTLHCQIRDLTDLLVGVGISQLGEEWYLSLARRAGS
jgi:hypothetical protein